MQPEGSKLRSDHCKHPGFSAGHLPYPPSVFPSGWQRHGWSFQKLLPPFPDRKYKKTQARLKVKIFVSRYSCFLKILLPMMPARALSVPCRSGCGFSRGADAGAAIVRPSAMLRMHCCTGTLEKCTVFFTVILYLIQFNIIQLSIKCKSYLRY